MFIGIPATGKSTFYQERFAAPHVRINGDMLKTEWRMEDAGRNCLNAHAYWILRKAGESAGDATTVISGLSNEQKRDLLQAHGTTYDALPAWQRRGFAVVWENYTKTGFNPITGQSESAIRTRLHEIFDLPSGSAYSEWVMAQGSFHD